MFRVTKRKPKTLRPSTIPKEDGENSEEDANVDGEPPTVVVKRKKKSKQRGGLTIRSFDNGYEEEGDVDVSSSGSKKKKRKKSKKGLGFGGGGGWKDADVDMDQQQQDDVEETETPSYGMEALEKLRAEQKKKTPQQQTTVSDSEIKTLPTEAPALTKAEADSADEIYIPLDDNDDAMHDGQETLNPTDLHGELNGTTGFQQDVDMDDAEAAQNWEDQIASRAGVGPKNSKGPGSVGTNNNNNSTMPVAASNLPALETLCSQLQSTATHVRAQQSDMTNAIMRRRADLAQLESVFKRHKTAVEEVGLACDYYQQMRNTLALWVGALRDLQQKVDPIYDSVMELIIQQCQMNQKEWIDWQDDAASFLQEAKLLSSIVGRQPKSFTDKDLPPAVDEFGRDVQSQVSREREKRHRSRIARHAFDDDTDNNSNGDDPDPFLWATWMEDGDLYSRYKTLLEALRVALNDLDDSYTELPELVNVFADWKKEFPDDFIQCYAKLSLGDLSSILIKVDFCRSTFVESMLRKYDEAKEGDKSQNLSWKPDLRAFEPADKSEEEGAIERILSKVYVPFFIALLKEAPSYCFLSLRKSKIMSSFVSSNIACLVSGSPLMMKTLDAVDDAVSSALGSVSVLFVDGMRLSHEKEGPGVVEAVKYSRDSQGKWIQCMLLNLLEYWVPLFQDTELYMKIGRNILTFVSNEFLFLLSSLDKTVASALLQPVWNRLRSSHSAWLDSPDLMLQGAPLRAAAAAYELRT